jgi:hypothetical protein
MKNHAEVIKIHKFDYISKTQLDLFVPIRALRLWNIILMWYPCVKEHITFMWYHPCVSHVSFTLCCNLSCSQCVYVHPYPSPYLDYIPDRWFPQADPAGSSRKLSLFRRLPAVSSKDYNGTGQIFSWYNQFENSLIEYLKSIPSLSIDQFNIENFSSIFVDGAFSRNRNFW